MTVEKIDLYDYFGVERPQGAKGYLTTYVRYRSPEFCIGRLRPAMLVIPGGGYAMVSDREGEPVAMAYLEKGYNAFVLDYSVNPVRYPAQLIEACMAMAYIRENAETYAIDNNHVAAIGFSAGGHLCGMLATLTEEKVVKEVLGERGAKCKPDAVVLSYPVIKYGENMHKGSFDNLCGDDESLKDYLSLEKRVNKDSSPAFIWCSADDTCVPAENSLVMAAAYKKHKIPFELHIYRSAIHGASVATKEIVAANYPEEVINGYVNPHVAKWVELSAEFLSELGFGIII